MAMNIRVRDYCAFTADPPYGVALVGRQFDGRVAVGAVFENSRALKPVLEALKHQLKKVHIDLSKVVGLFEDHEQGTELAVMAEDIIPIGWGRCYKTLEAARQSLESFVSTQGPVTSRFQIDKDAPGAEFLAQAIDNRVTGGIYDATAICCLQIEQDYEAGKGDDVRVVSDFPGHNRWREQSRTRQGGF